MDIDCRAERTLPCTVQQAFDLLCDTGRFPQFFRGHGPIPAVTSIVADGPLRVGCTRRVRNADGTTLTEVVTAFDPPSKHAYRLSGFRAPFAWLVRHGDAEWSVSDDGTGARVRWVYRFELTHAGAAPIARVLLHFMSRAMQRCLDAMAHDVSARDALPGPAR